MTFHFASPACPSARRFLKQCHVPAPRIGKLSIAGCDFTHSGEAHRSSSSSSGCRRLLCDQRSLDDVVAPQGQHCLAAWASARSTVADARLVLTGSTGAISCRERRAHGGVAFELLCMLASSHMYARVHAPKHAPSLCREGVSTQTDLEIWCLCAPTLLLWMNPLSPDRSGRCTSSTGE
jgi:hypothetical protein